MNDRIAVSEAVDIGCHIMQSTFDNVEDARKPEGTKGLNTRMDKTVDSLRGATQQVPEQPRSDESIAPGDKYRHWHSIGCGWSLRQSFELDPPTE